jgi:replicative DNA helicase
MLQRNFPKFANLVKGGDFDAAEDLLKEIVTYRPTKNLALGVGLDANPMLRIERRMSEESDFILLLIPELDRIFGGVRRGELAVWQSQRSSGGKTTGLVHCAKAAVFQGHKVLIYTLEESEEDYQDRLDQAIAGLEKSELTNYEKLSKKLREWFRHGGDIHIKQFPPGLTRVSDLRAHQQMLANTQGFHADLIIVDQADELISERTRSQESSLFDEGKNIYTHLRGWAVEDQIVIWTGMQSQRGAASETVADQEHAGTSIAKVWVSDIILSINRTPKEADENLTRIFITKNRHGGGDRFAITVTSDMDRQLFYKYA